MACILGGFWLNGKKFPYGKPVDLGVPFDWMETNAGAFYHLEEDAEPWPGGDQFAVNFHRELLLRTMVTAGFSCYPHEIWHFNYGNQMDAVVSGKTARYGYIEP
jgi:D-alanyl-D-alanine dipeptidase